MSQDITPSSQNGVTRGSWENCGVGFAHLRPSDHQRLIQWMGRRRGYPEPVAERRLTWAWGKLSGLHGWLSQSNFDIDIGAQLPHAEN